MKRSVFYWRRLDVEGLERLELATGPEGGTADGVVLTLESGGLCLAHRWRFDADWRAVALTVERRGPDGIGRLDLERSGAGWRVNGEDRPDLDGALEPDLSVTPFCNSLPIRRTPPSAGAVFTLDTAFIDGPALTVTRSRQRYERLGPRRLRYVDLGLARGFTAELAVDADGLIESYEHLFRRVEPDQAE